ncbi:MAG: hypothetical protein IPJ60_01640 [Sphingobacteriaceae bacterium]|nr:hypothetical protein [Sphingobacteriaceae bacterium]
MAAVEKEFKALGFDEVRINKKVNIVDKPIFSDKLYKKEGSSDDVGIYPTKASAGVEYRTVPAKSENGDKKQ